MTGRGARGGPTARCSSTWCAAARSICYPTGLRPPETGTLAAWLRAHPGVEFVSRDRDGVYAEGAASGAPAAVQIADRFHLLRNLTDAVGEVLERHRRAVHAAVPPSERPAPAPVKRGGPVARRTPQPRATERRKAATRERRHASYEQVVALWERGLSKLAIDRHTGVSRHTIIRWLGRT